MPEKTKAEYLRLFIAADLPEEIKNYLFEIQKNIKSGNLAKINFVHKKNIHLTLKFLGNIEENKIKNIKEKLSEIKLNKFELIVDKFSAFPNIKNPKVLWFGIKKEEKLFELQKKIDELTLDFTNESIDFSPHLTIARIKSIKNKSEFSKILEKIEIKKLNFKIESFSLYKSTLSKNGPKYGLLENYKLTQI